MVRSRPAGLIAGFLLLLAVPVSTLAADPPDGSGPVPQQNRCGEPGLPPCPPPNTPVIAISKTASPSTLPPGGGSVTFTYAVSNHGTLPLANVTVVDNRCSPVTFVSGDTNGNNILDVSETWTYTCTTNVAQTTTNTAVAGAIGVGTNQTTTSSAQATVQVAERCPPNSTDPNCVPPPTCRPGTTTAGCQPTPSTLVYECFALNSSTRNPGAIAMLTTKNFGNDTVIVRKSERMCEPALKTTKQPPTGTLAPAVYPNAELSLNLMGPGGQTQQVMLYGVAAVKRMAEPMGVYDTEMLQLSLQGSAPLMVHEQHGLGDSFFDVFFELNHMVHSPGRVGSFFDIWPEISLTPNSMLGPGGAPTTLMPRDALRFILRNGRFELQKQELIVLNTPRLVDSGWSIQDAILILTPPTRPSQANWRVYECFTIQRGANPDDPYTLTTRNFGTHRVIVNRATRMCEGAIKSRQTLPSDVLPQPAPSVWECFDIVSGSFQQRSFWLQTRNFGREQVRVLKPHSLCEEARKIRLSSNGAAGQTIGQPTGRVLECFTIEAKSRNVPYFLRTRNFGLDSVRIGRGNLLCEPAVKQPGGRFSTN